MAMVGKTLGDEGSQDESGKRHEKCQQAVHYMTMEKSWVMMMHKTDKAHKG